MSIDLHSNYSARDFGPLRGFLLAAVLLGATGLDLACGGGGGTQLRPPTPTPVPVTGTIAGTVRDSVSGMVIPGASVTVGTTTTTSGADGTFALTAAPSDRTQITVKAASYGDTQRIAQVTGGTTNKVDVALVAATVTQIADLSAGASVGVPNSPAQVVLPVDGLVTSGGGAPSFPIYASLTPIDPTSNPLLMPGDYTTTAGEKLMSYGALDVTFTDRTGTPVNLAAGKQATIRIPVASFYHGDVDAPHSVPAWYFNTTTGLWVQEGVLTLFGTGTDQYYEGTVSHFTTWNADNAAATTCITGRVIRNDTGKTPAAGAVVTATGQNYLGTSSVVTASDGTFQMLVMKGQKFSLSASQGYLMTANSPILVVDNPSCTLNGSFSDTSFWVAGANWTIATGLATHTAGTGNTATLAETQLALAANTQYTVAYTISGVTAGSVNFTLGGTSGTPRSTNGTFSEVVKTGSSSSDLVFTPTATFNGSITGISVILVSSTPTCQPVGDLVLQGNLTLTGTLRDFSPSAPYLFPYILSTNGTFDTDTNWNKGSGWSIASNLATCGAHSGSSVLSQSQPLLLNGETYTVTYTVSSRTAGSIKVSLGGTAGTSRSAAGGPYTENIVCGNGADPKLAFTADSSFRGSITGVTVSGHPPSLTIDANTPFPEYNRTGGDPILALSDGPWWNPDFEMSNTWGDNPPPKNLVKVALGPNNKPVLSTNNNWTHGNIHSAASFNAWWTDFAYPHGTGDPQAYQGLYTIPLTEQLSPQTSPPTYVYLNDAQFPADGKYQGNYLWNNIGSTSGTSSANRGLNATNPPHNFAYTYELHLMFVYHSGQVFTFKGDDDVYVFMNKLLVIDLGGVHSSISKTITLNSSTKATDGVTALNLVEGQAYQFDFFYCERHTTESHMQISTTIPLNDSIIPN